MTDQLTIFDYPLHPGAKEQDTSQEAAEAIASRAPRLRALVLRTLVVNGPMTADEAAAHLKIDKLSIRPRFTELLRDGLIVDAGYRRRNPSGKAAKVWRLPQ